MVARRDDPVERRPSGDAVVGVHLVVPPGVVGEDDVGLVLADDAADLTAQGHRALELPVVVAEEHEVLDPDGLARRALLALARVGHPRRRHLRVVRALLAAREHAVRDLRAAVRDPGRERAGATEIDVIGVREDRHGARRDRECLRH